MSVPLVRAPNLLRRVGVVHGFTSRLGGVSEGALASLNLAMRADERPERVVENWQRAVRAVDPALDPEAVALLEQVHGAEVVRVARGAGPLAVVAQADAAFTTEIGVPLAVRVADCVPVLVAGPGVVAIAHAGWRGTAARIVARLVEALVAIGVDPASLSGVVGPCISGAVYAVGDEVVEALRAAGLADRDFLEPGRRVELRRAVAAQLRAAGVDDVWVDGRCTATDPDLFSHRRDGPAAGRLAGVVARLS